MAEAPDVLIDRPAISSRPVPRARGDGARCLADAIPGSAKCAIAFHDRGNGDMAMVDTIAPIETTAPAEIFDACFLGSETISAYLQHIAGAGTKPDPRFRLFDWPVQWSG